jgi:hypothetical protein
MQDTLVPIPKVPKEFSRNSPVSHPVNPTHFFKKKKSSTKFPAVKGKKTQYDLKF